MCQTFTPCSSFKNGACSRTNVRVMSFTTRPPEVSATKTGLSARSSGLLESRELQSLPTPSWGTTIAIRSVCGETSSASIALATASRSAPPLFAEVGVTRSTASPVSRM